jgi:hypothetical protein
LYSGSFQGLKPISLSIVKASIVSQFTSITLLTAELVGQTITKDTLDSFNISVNTFVVNVFQDQAGHNNNDTFLSKQFFTHLTCSEVKVSISLLLDKSNLYSDFLFFLFVKKSDIYFSKK